MLRKLSDLQATESPFRVGTEVFLVTRQGTILEGFRIARVLLDQVMLDHPPLPDSPKQGFTITGSLLRPNWCAGKRAIRAGFLTRQEAESHLTN